MYVHVHAWIYALDSISLGQTRYVLIQNVPAPCVGLSVLLLLPYEAEPFKRIKIISPTNGSIQKLMFSDCINKTK